MSKVLGDPYGQAIYNYHFNKSEAKLIVKASDFDDDEMQIPYLFRSYKDMPKLEQLALTKCRGKVLDIGAGAGCHSVYLHGKGFDVSALEKSTLASKVLADRGLNVLNYDVNFYQGDTYDTLLLMMNGIGLAGTLSNLTPFLTKLKKLLKPGGQILLDSSDIIYLFENEDGSVDVNLNTAYHGEMQFQFEYNRIKSDWFPWLYVDKEMLKICAKNAGLSCEIIDEGKHYDFLALLR